MNIKTINSLNIKNIVNTSTNDSIIGFDNNTSRIALGSISDIYLSNIYIKNLESPNVQEESQSKKSSENTKVAPAASSINPLPYIMLVVYYDSNNDEWINLTGVTSNDLYKASNYGFPIFCYVYSNDYGWSLLSPSSLDPTIFGNFVVGSDGSISLNGPI